MLSFVRVVGETAEGVGCGYIRDWGRCGRDEGVGGREYRGKSCAHDAVVGDGATRALATGWWEIDRRDGMRDCHATPGVGAEVVGSEGHYC
jgi:hypothetical protein